MITKGSFKKGCVPWIKGRHHSAETVEKIRNSNLGKKRSALTSKNLSLAKKGCVSCMKGKKHTEEAKLKMSESHKGIVPWNEGKKLTLEHRKKLSIAKKGKSSPLKGRHTGKIAVNNKGYTHNINKLIRLMYEYKQWRSNCFERDKYTCQNCRARGVYITVHHIKSVSHIIQSNKIKTIIDASKCEDLWDTNNGVTLCEDCHRLTDNYKGKSKKNMESEE
ncbi:NUMOD3 domain-containing DNA-binding protein [Methanoculleus sp.]|uniref:NUMOD3 domain-containing DNA-binding protein n=1 Tax=Methanoculleus sp. TaxID=90427 RepID=UPI0025ED53E7|nr:NUMOD3 domain-containing DNA-binding protein [Methanoculleus sp.]MCK9319948.1 NUMOD3 domain-containing DNA-binding protein [Methanoculleus sp.]